MFQPRQRFENHALRGSVWSWTRHARSSFPLIDMRTIRKRRTRQAQRKASKGSCWSWIFRSDSSTDIFPSETRS